jgi:hypothetical protein
MSTISIPNNDEAWDEFQKAMDQIQDGWAKEIEAFAKALNVPD